MPCALRARYQRDLGIGLQLVSATHGHLEWAYLNIRKVIKIFGVRDASEQCRRSVGVESEF